MEGNRLAAARCYFTSIKEGEPAARNHRKDASDPGEEAFMYPPMEQRRSVQSTSVSWSV